jgi:hypothetical protein
MMPEILAWEEILATCGNPKLIMFCWQNFRIGLISDKQIEI